MIMGEGKGPIQFGLRTLLLLVSVTAVVLGAAKWLGPVVLSFIMIAIGIWIMVRTRARHVLVWLVPSLWSVCAFGSWHHPGDEYGMFIVSVLPCVWLAIVFDYGHLSEAYLMLIASGALLMACLGYLLDRLPVSRRLWSAVYLVASLGWFAWMLWQFPTLKAAIAKNGSISAYAFLGANLGLYVSVLVFLAGGTVLWLWRRARGRRVAA